jgi:NusA-like KH domain protein
LGRLKLDPDALGISSLFERVTGVKVKDCFKDSETLYFIVAPGTIRKAVGKGGENIKRIQLKMDKRVKVIEYRDDVISFVGSVIYPITVEEIIQDDDVIFIKDSHKKTKSLLIGRDGKNLQIINRAVKRFFNVEVKVM